MTPTLAETVPWPNPIADAGMYGIAGEFVRLVSPHTEADPNIILLAFLTYAGNILGRQYFMMTGSDHHCGNMYLCTVGATGVGRKGSAISVVETFFRKFYGGAGNSTPGLAHRLDGISTGEGVIWEIHDRIMKRELNKHTKNFEDVISEEEVKDKRLLIYLSEFHQCISAMRRQDSILSSIFRQAWDRDIISSPAKTSPAHASGAHVSIIGCITKEELLRQTDAADAENGTLNRFIFACSRRSKLLPSGGKFSKLAHSSEWQNLRDRFETNIVNSVGASLLMERDANALDDWGVDEKPNVGIYNPLSQARAGLWGAVTVRAPQQVMRLSLIIATINGYREIRLEHQDAASALWRYCDDSAKYIWGSVDNPMLTELLDELRAAGDAGMTRTQINRIWNSKKPAILIAAALSDLARGGIIRLQMESTSGRSTEKWFAI